jgi:hypothetical protein
MTRRGEDFWRTAVEQQRASGLNATRYCKKRSLKRGTFLRWRKRLGEQDFIEVPMITLPCMPLCENKGLEVQIDGDVRITVHSDSDLDLVGRFIATIRRVS